MTPANGYRDRTAAGQVLASLLNRHRYAENGLVLALPRGGVPVARPIALALSVPMDVFVVRKIGLPDSPETAMGAIATGGVQLLDDTLISELSLPKRVVDLMVAKETLELQRRETLYRSGGSARDLAGKAIVLVDDGVATGYTIRVAILALRQLNPASLTVAIPVGAPETCTVLEGLVDELICPLRPDPFHAVGLWYDHFPPVTDEEVRDGIAETVEVAKARSSESPL
ncbi:MAG: phosphoribosyltransferase family protein [Opitutus sp.]